MTKRADPHPNGTVFRVVKTKNYTIMSNYHLRDTELSLKAMGLFCLILSLPENWNYTMTGLAALSRDSIDSVRSGLKELETGGYISRRRLRTPDGRLGANEYLVYENPANNSAYQPETPSAARICCWASLSE